MISHFLNIYAAGGLFALAIMIGYGNTRGRWHRSSDYWIPKQFLVPMGVVSVIAALLIAAIYRHAVIDSYKWLIHGLSVTVLIVLFFKTLKQWLITDSPVPRHPAIVWNLFISFIFILPAVLWLEVEANRFFDPRSAQVIELPILSIGQEVISGSRISVTKAYFAYVPDWQKTGQQVGVIIGDSQVPAVKESSLIRLTYNEGLFGIRVVKNSEWVIKSVVNE